jgi:rubredoxin
MTHTAHCDSCGFVFTVDEPQAETAVGEELPEWSIECPQCGARAEIAVDAGTEFLDGRLVAFSS